MKKLIIVLMLTFIAVGCSNSKENNETSESEDNADQEIATQGKVYDSNETAKVIDSDSGSTYEVTFNSAKLMEEYNGKTVQEFTGLEEFKSDKYVVINATFKNTSEHPINLKEQINPEFGKYGVESAVLSNYEMKIDKGIKAGEKFTVDLLYLWQDFDENVKYFLTFENFKENQTHITVPYPG
ncbi:hypothetical protein [Virgibacillus oceani]|uniref:DUF4352 domain-containing protein n=1 Tax=Virgibacillus oceani TaxID=1479511 RepID=A0A917GZW1_9BACI|nr:hypothetical protein [Virgibacillus oceani]GGG62988.1 hypothetical protein GCM10011398_02970 [Virgibacillus oceani]